MNRGGVLDAIFGGYEISWIQTVTTASLNGEPLMDLQLRFSW